MTILDGHIHLMDNSAPQPAAFLAEMAQAGVSGAALISQPPPCFGRGDGSPAEGRGTGPAAARLQHVLDWCPAGSGLHPLFWIDPTEEDAVAQVNMAVAKGVAGFKVICDHFAPGHAAALTTFCAIAAAGKPILFHSGILWDGKPSSQYNRPAGFEPLLDVPGLRFALAHIGWPWCDEMVAVYGKFLNTLSHAGAKRVEMFVDLTPGTPPIYRQRALTDLFCSTYDVANNVIFGTDCRAPGYNVAWAQEWLQRDEQILMSLGLGQEVLAKVRGENLRRFLGLSEQRVERAIPLSGQ